MVSYLSRMTVLDSHLAPPWKSAKWTLVYKIQKDLVYLSGILGIPQKRPSNQPGNQWAKPSRRGVSESVIVIHSK